MRKIVLLSSVALMFVSCKTLDKNAEAKIKGNWVLTEVSFPKGYKVTPFNIADSKCMVNSEWFFVANNNKGTVTINGNRNCAANNLNIVWTVGLDKSFNLKVLNAGEDASDKKEGYKLTIANQTETSFQLIDQSTEIGIVYTFEKINN